MILLILLLGQPHLMLDSKFITVFPCIFYTITKNCFTFLLTKLNDIIIIKVAKYLRLYDKK